MSTKTEPRGPSGTRGDGAAMSEVDRASENHADFVAVCGPAEYEGRLTVATSCIYVDSGDWPAFYRDSIRRAQKEYPCCECGEPIRPGDLHEYVVGKWDSLLESYRTCARCVNVRDEYFDGWLFGGMVECFQEEHGVDYRDGIPSHIAPCRPTSIPSGDTGTE